MSTVLRAGFVINSGGKRKTREYEISDCLRRCHLDILEKKYGGAERAHKAATIIQRCYRNYRLSKFYKGIVPQKKSIRSKSSTAGLYPMKSESYINRVLQSHNNNMSSCQGRHLSPCWKQPEDKNLPDPHLTRNFNSTITEIYNYSAPTRKGTGIVMGNNTSSSEKLTPYSTYIKGINILTPSDDIIFSSKSKPTNDNSFINGVKEEAEQMYQTYQTLQFDPNCSSKDTTFSDTLNSTLDTTNQLSETFSNYSSNNYTPTNMNYFSKSFCNTSSPRLAPHRRPIHSTLAKGKLLHGMETFNDSGDSSNLNHHLSTTFLNDDPTSTYKRVNYGNSSPNVWVLRNSKLGENNHQKSNVTSTGENEIFNLSTKSCKPNFLFGNSPQSQPKNMCMAPNNSRGPSSTLLNSKEFAGNDYVNSRNDNRGFSKSANMISTHKSRLQNTENGECVLRIGDMFEKSADNKRRRLYRICLNFFNKKPDRGIALLAKNGFIQGSPEEVAHFFLTRRGLSRKKIGEFLGTHNSKYHTDVLNRYVEYMDVRDLPIDIAIREFMKYFTLPGEAQQIDRIVTAFARHYAKTSYNEIFGKVSEDGIHILAFAVIILNTDLYSPHLKKEKRMSCSDFVKNTRQAHELGNLPVECYEEIYHRIKNNEILPARDHVTQVANLQSCLIGKNKPNLIEQHRRLICYCRMNQYKGGNKKQSTSAHCRELFLFNDSLMIAKISRNKNGEDQYTVRFFEQLEQLSVTTYESKYVEHGIRIYDKKGNETILIARTISDQQRFIMDLKESLLECMSMESVRLGMQVDLSKFKDQNISLGSELMYYYKINNGTENQRDSGLSDVEPSVSSLCPSSSSSSNVKAPSTAPPTRRLSYNSLDSGVIEGVCDL